MLRRALKMRGASHPPTSTSGWPSSAYEGRLLTGTTIITFLMVFLIQNAQNREASAIQAKLDELIRAVEGARNEFIGIEHLTERELEGIRDALESLPDSSGVSHEAVERLLKRW